MNGTIREMTTSAGGSSSTRRYLRGDASDDVAEGHAADGGDDEVAHRPREEEATREGRHHRASVQDERGRVVEERLALDDRHDVRGTPSRRKTVVAASASVGATIAPSVRAAGQPRPGISASTTAATANAVTMTSPKARRAIGPRLRAQVAEGRLECGPEQERWQEDEQHDVGLEHDLRHAGDEPECGPADDEERRVWHAEAPGDLVEADDDDDRDEEGAQDAQRILCHAEEARPAGQRGVGFGRAADMR